MEHGKTEELVDGPDIRERFFGSAGNSKAKQRHQSISKKPSLKRTSHDDPVPADSYTSCKLDEPVRLRMADKGALAQKPMTVMTALQMTAEKYPDQDCFAVKVNGKWQMTKMRDVHHMVRTAAKGFLRLGLMKYHSVAILGDNAPEWVVSYLAAIYAGGVSVGINQNQTAEDCKWRIILVHCQIIVVDTAEDLAKVLHFRSSLPDLLAIVHYGTEGFKKMGGVYTWKELLEMGMSESEDSLKESILSQAPNYCCSVAFTIGSHGPPKPVMLSHDNLIWTGRIFGKYLSMSSFGGVHLSFVPFGQPTAAILDIIIPLIYATTIYFAPWKLIKKNLFDVMREVRPTFFFAVPFFFEKIAAGLQMSFDEGSLKRYIAKRAMKVGWRAYLNDKDGKPRPFGWWLANQLVFKKVHRRLGFDRCLEVFSAKSYLLDRTIEFFISLGMTVLNAYGSCELSGPHSISLLERNRFGSCGVEMDGCHTIFVPIGQTIYNEMRIKGRHVFMGYLDEPQMTAEAFDEEGWYKTADMGYKDESGYLYSIGSVNELFQMADGRVVAPVPLEQSVKARLHGINHCVAYGQNRQYVIALLTFRAKSDDATDIPTDVLSKQAELWLRKMNVSASAISKMAANPSEDLVALIQSAIDKVNTSLLDSATVIRKWKLLPRDFSIPTGELSAAYRMKRPVIHELYATTIESLYDSD